MIHAFLRKCWRTHPNALKNNILLRSFDSGAARSERTQIKTDHRHSLLGTSVVFRSCGVSGDPVYSFLCSPLIANCRYALMYPSTVTGCGSAAGESPRRILSDLLQQRSASAARLIESCFCCALLFQSQQPICRNIQCFTDIEYCRHFKVKLTAFIALPCLLRYFHLFRHIYLCVTLALSCLF